jgi:uncharacterized membrane protein YfcA
MIYFSEIGLHVSLVLLLFLGFAVGVVSGFIGVGGGFLMTPALIALGFPGTVAVGTGLATIAGNSIVATARHRQLGNVDVRLAATMVVGLLAGAEVGVRFVDWLKTRGFADQGVLTASLLLTAFIATFTGWETRRAKRQGAEVGTGSRRVLGLRRHRPRLHTFDLQLRPQRHSS